MQARGRMLGVIAASRTTPDRPYDAEDVALLQEFADRAALAIDNARLARDAQAAERRYRGLFEGVADAILVADAERRYLDVNAAATSLLGYDRQELIGLQMEDIVVVDPTWAETEFARFLADGHWQGELEARRRDGSTVPVEVRATVVALPEGPVYLSAARDIAARVAAFSQLERRLHGLSAVARSLTVGQTLETTLGSLAAEVVRVTPAVACSVKLIDTEHHRVQTVATSGLPEGYAEAIETAHRAGANLASLEAYRTRRPVLRSIRRDLLPDPLHAPLHQFLQDIAGDTILSVPVVYRDRVLGTLSGTYPIGHDPDHEEMAFFLTIADQLAVAVENARLFVDAQGKAALEERQRLARELHDSVSQSIYGLTLYTKAASRLLADGNGTTAATHLDEMSTIAHEALQEMRRLIFELRPPLLEEEGLVAALRARLEAVESRAGLDVTLDAEDIGRLPADIEHALYRIGQEALTNTMKHARARSVSVALRRQQEQITMIIDDDGTGFDPIATNGHGGLGLSGMAERAALVGGQMCVESAPGVGTRVQVEIMA
ncbi:MAG: histidine kinase, partial [Chloroflexota bacterium]|nr:histidine kinase [Chloroflexota bacterium]